jgi:hypothetical protein
VVNSGTNDNNFVGSEETCESYSGIVGSVGIGGRGGSGGVVCTAAVGNLSSFSTSANTALPHTPHSHPAVVPARVESIEPGFGVVDEEKFSTFCYVLISCLLSLDLIQMGFTRSIIWSNSSLLSICALYFPSINDCVISVYTVLW